MSVEVRYHVIRDGKEVAVYTSKKEADAHDKMLDIAAELAEFISQTKKINIAEDVLEELCVYLSKNRDQVLRLLKGIKRPLSPLKSASSSNKKIERQKKETSKTANIKETQKDQPNIPKSSATITKQSVLTSPKKSRKKAAPKK
jgi:dsDNA-binding SOS-regulon protein